MKTLQERYEVFDIELTKEEAKKPFKSATRNIVEKKLKKLLEI